MTKAAFAVPLVLFMFSGCDPDSKPVHTGNMSLVSGSPTTRGNLPDRPDNPRTTNDESNDQPQGYFGNTTLSVTNESSGHTYPLDADIEDGRLRRLYFPKGGWVDFPGCDLDGGGLTGECEDERGRRWTINGKS